ncbi:MAG TPA: YceI family protein [Polyangiales bacterium]
MDAIIHAYTFKEGLLSKLAHDLRFTLTRFSISVRGSEITGRFTLASLRVDGVMRAGKLERNELSPNDRERIQETMQDVLRVRDQAEARLSARLVNAAPPFLIDGQLTLGGETRPIQTRLELDSDRLLGAITLVPSQWGIKPYRALGGTLKLQDRVRIAIDASAEWMSGGVELNPSVELTWGPRSSRSSLRPSAH